MFNLPEHHHGSPHLTPREPLYSKGHVTVGKGAQGPLVQLHIARPCNCQSNGAFGQHFEYVVEVLDLRGDTVKMGHKTPDWVSPQIKNH